METLQIIVTAFITSGLVSAGVSWYLRIQERDELRRWEIKREACLEALRIIDCRFADYIWKDADGNLKKVDKQEFIPTSEIRSCFNRLVLACETSEVPESFAECLALDLGTGHTPVSMNSVVDLRNKIRQELGFGKANSIKLAWIMYINWKREEVDSANSQDSGFPPSREQRRVIPSAPAQSVSDDAER